MKKCKFCKKEIPDRNIYCNNKCQNHYQRMKYVKRWIDGKVDGTTKDGCLSEHIRSFLIGNLGIKGCPTCCWDKKNPVTGKIPLEIDHIDGDHTNNSWQNLRVLCPNCHSLTPTYRGLNRGHGRKSRK